MDEKKNDVRFMQCVIFALKMFFVFMQRAGTAVVFFIFHSQDLFTHKWANVSMYSDIQMNPLFP